MVSLRCRLEQIRHCNSHTWSTKGLDGGKTLTATITKESSFTTQGTVKGPIVGETEMSIREIFRKTRGKVRISGCLCGKLSPAFQP
jgi:hypothetical protein